MNETMIQISRQFEVLPEYLGWHIALSLTSLVVGILVSVPLGIYASRNKTLEFIALTSASLIQTIPSLALLALIVFVWGQIGWVPALIALILYSVLPILRNTVIGLQGIDPAVIEASRGVGMTDRQMLWMVQMPLAASTIIAGVRTAAVWVVGLATIAEPVGAISLGNYIFVGLQTSNSIALLFGCFFSAGLALVLDGLLRRLQNAVKARDRNRMIRLVVALALVFASPLGLMLLKATPKPTTAEIASDSATPQDTQPFVIGGKGFTEQLILSRAIKSRLDNAGVRTELRDDLASSILFDALKKGEVDIYVDYTGTLWVNVLKKEQTESGPEMLVDVASELRQKYGIVTLGALGFENSYAMAVRRADAEKFHLKTLADLAKVSSHMRLASEVEFLGRPEWQSLQHVYGLDFAEKPSMDATLMYGAIKNNQVDAIAAFSTDGRIAAYDLVTLEDSRQAMPPYDAMVLLSPRAARNPAVVAAIRPLLNVISTEEMRDANKHVDLDKQTPDQAAATLLHDVIRQ